MIPILTLFVVVILSLLVVRVATVALTLTGLSQPIARFQARSAFTGAGFTTTESEQLMNHPVRRQVIRLLMLLGNAGFITAISTLLLSFLRLNQGSGWTGTVWFRLTLLIAGLTVLWLVAHSVWVDRWLTRLITHALKRWTDLELRDYAGLLHLAKEYAVAELLVRDGDWLAHRALGDLRLADEGVVVLGIQKPNGVYLGAPRGETNLEPDDTLIVYGRKEAFAELDSRRAGAEGNWEHHKGVEKQMKVEVEEQAAVEEATPEQTIKGAEK